MSAVALVGLFFSTSADVTTAGLDGVGVVVVVVVVVAMSETLRFLD